MNDPTAPTSPSADDTTPPAMPAAPASASPGALVRQARERAGLGVDDLAAQIKLAKGTLDALERDDFAVLSEPVYVRGYYRRISKVLPVTEAELLDAYAARVQPKAAPPLPRIPLAGGVSAGASRSYRNQGIALMIAAAVVVLLLFLFANPRKAPPAAPAASQAPVAVPSAPSPATTPTPPTAETAAAAPAAGTAAPPAAAPSGPVPAVPNQLLMEFAQSSFVRVEDSRSKTLAIGLVRGGERQVLDGQPPYTVFLGNAQHVKVYFGGAPVDFSAHINSQNDTARFTVP